MVEPKGIEPLSKNCEFSILPLNDSPISEFIDVHVNLSLKDRYSHTRRLKWRRRRESNSHYYRDRPLL